MQTTSMQIQDVEDPGRSLARQRITTIIQMLKSHAPVSDVDTALTVCSQIRVAWSNSHEWLLFQSRLSSVRAFLGQAIEVPSNQLAALNTLLLMLDSLG